MDCLVELNRDAPQINLQWFACAPQKPWDNLLVKLGTVLVLLSLEVSGSISCDGYITHVELRYL